MDPTFVKSSIENDFRQGLKLVRDLLKDIRVQNANLSQRPAFQSLNDLLGDSNDAITSEIERFTFIIPVHTFRGMVQNLGHIQPKLGLHYTERNNVLHMNTNVASYNYRDPVAETHKAVQRRKADAENTPQPELYKLFDDTKADIEAKN
jgi:hypothetical protein